MLSIHSREKIRISYIQVEGIKRSIIVVPLLILLYSQINIRKEKKRKRIYQ